MRTAVVLFTRDLRVQDHPALATAAREADRVVPLFVVDERILAAGFAVPHRAAFLADALADLDEALRERGGRLAVRRGDVERGRAGGVARGRTGYRVVDAAMRELAREGFMHNRARLIVASFLTRDLGVDWRLGAAHFLELLVDGDLANSGNWQWVAGTGNDTRPNRVLNPLRQARRFDPSGDDVRRYLPELETVEGPAAHEPWRLDAATRRRLDRPEPMVHHAEAARAARAGRARPGAAAPLRRLRACPADAGLGFGQWPNPSSRPSSRSGATTSARSATSPASARSG
jgi:deoxyribodipyrimidine photolyase